MQTIITRYVPLSFTLPARIKAFTPEKSMWVGCKNDLTAEENHRAAALDFILRMEWMGVWLRADLPKGEIVWVRVDVDIKNAPHSHVVNMFELEMKKLLEGSK